MSEPKKTFWLYIYYPALLILFVALAGINAHLKLMNESISFLFVSSGIITVLFGVFDAKAEVKIGGDSETSKIPILGRATIGLGGSIAGLYVIFLMVTNVETPRAPSNETQLFDLVFTAPLNKEPSIEHFNSERLLVHQKTPVSTYKDHPIVPSKFIGSRIGQYEIKERRIKQVGDKFDARVKREVLSSFVGQLNEIPQFDLCFTYSSEGPIEATFECSDRSCVLNPLSKNIEACPVQNADSGWQLFNMAYASGTAIGWITPSLDILKKNYQSDQHTYVEFDVTAADLKLPENVDSFSYQLEVNQQLVFINGWTEAETTSVFDPKQPFHLSFGLQNLDFSGADFGQENLQLTLTFYSAGQKIRTDTINRNYTALRTVQPISNVVSDVLYNWAGQQHFGKSDGFEVFIWSSTSADEIVKKRKKFFDEANLQYQGAKVVAVVRPPLSKNPNYGLVLGLADSAGRIDFTFPHATATEIANWLRQDVAPLKTAVRPETKRQHPLIKDVSLYQIGH